MRLQRSTAAEAFIPVAEERLQSAELKVEAAYEAVLSLSLIADEAKALRLFDDAVAAGKKNEMRASAGKIAEALSAIAALRRYLLLHSQDSDLLWPGD